MVNRRKEEINQTGYLTMTSSRNFRVVVRNVDMPEEQERDVVEIAAQVSHAILMIICLSSKYLWQDTLPFFHYYHKSSKEYLILTPNHFWIFLTRQFFIDLFQISWFNLLKTFSVVFNDFKKFNYMKGKKKLSYSKS